VRRPYYPCPGRSLVIGLGTRRYSRGATRANTGVPGVAAEFRLHEDVRQPCKCAYNEQSAVGEATGPERLEVDPRGTPESQV
jgi:hypothetical protein